MYSICDVNKKEKSMHKGHNSYISNEEYKDILINKKVIRHKMTGIKTQIIKYLHMKVIKYLYLVMMISVMFFLME